jgi:hypothetical protein
MIADFNADAKLEGLPEAQVDFWGTAVAEWENTGDQLHLALLELKGAGYMWVCWNVGIRQWRACGGYVKTLKEAVELLSLLCPEARLVFRLSHLSPTGKMFPGVEDDFYSTPSTLENTALSPLRRLLGL